MDDFEGSYAPQSPDLSGLNDFDDPQPTFQHQRPQYHPQQTSYHIPPPYSQAPPQHNPYAFHPQQSAQPAYQYQPPAMPSNGRSKPPTEDAEYVPEPNSSKGAGSRKAKKGSKVVEEEICEKPAPGVAEGVDVKTKFPVARIKRIMQADEDVGKVSQVTPTAVSKALELFMISIVTKSADLAAAKQSKRVTAQHLKQAVQSDEQFDFLAEIVAKVPDAPTSSGKKKEDEDGEGESDEMIAPTPAPAEGGKKRRRAAAGAGGKKKKKEDGDEDDE